MVKNVKHDAGNLQNDLSLTIDLNKKERVNNWVSRGCDEGGSCYYNKERKRSPLTMPSV